jgi:hypothetical protein
MLAGLLRVVLSILAGAGLFGEPVDDPVAARAARTGDEVMLEDSSGGTHEYEVSEIFVVDPSEILKERQAISDAIDVFVAPRRQLARPA